MDLSTMHIEDIVLLIALRQALDHCGDSLLKIQKDVDKYLDGTKECFELQRDLLEDQFEDAKQVLKEAESALSDCENSQVWDEEDRCYYPSCNMEQSNVNAANKHYYECEDRYNKACGIVISANAAISNYREQRMYGSSPQWRLICLAGNHTSAAIRKLNDIIADVEDYLEIRDKDIFEKEALPHDQKEKFEEAGDKIREMQQWQLSHDIADANVLMFCSKCKEPFDKCICAREIERYMF